MAEQPNVVLVVIDTTRVDDAYDVQVAPTLANLANSGTRATQAFSAAPWTLPAHASLLTGTHSSKHGAHAGHERLDDRLPMLSECFKNAGYETACVSNNTWLSAESGFDRGFDSFQQMWQVVQSGNALSELVDVNEERRVQAVAEGLLEGNPVANAANALYRYFLRARSDDGATRSTKWITDWLSGREGEDPFFLLVNYLEPHLEYRPPKRLVERYLPANTTYEDAMDVPQEPWEYLAGNVDLSESDFRLLRALYRAEIAYVDEQLATLRNTLEESGELHDTIFVVTSDHGENIGDHGLMDHQYCLYDTLIHVPLVLDGGAFSERGDVTDLISLVDVAPTLLDEAGIDASEARESFQGVSFHPDSDREPREFVISEYMEPLPSMDALERNVGDLPEHVRKYDRSLGMIRTPEYKLVRGSDGSRELYDFTKSSEEREDLAEVRPSIADNLESIFDDWLDSFDRASNTDSVTISEGRKARLEQLGYLQ